MVYLQDPLQKDKSDSHTRDREIEKDFSLKKKR